jgi:hypothetical protein
VTGRRVYLARTVDGWSAGTLLARRGEQPGDAVLASPWGQPDVLLTLRPDHVVERRPRGGHVRPPRQPSRRQRKLPLVYSTCRAREQAADLLPGRPVENAVYDAIVAGRLSHEPDEGAAAAVHLTDHLDATVTRARSLTSGRRSWLVTEVAAR